MSVTNATSPKRGFLPRLWGSRGTTIAGFHRGNVQDGSRIVVPAQAVLVGDAVAPKIEVRGIIYGFVVAQELVVYAGGEIWGDIYAQTYQLLSGSKVYGWFGTLPEEQFSTLLETPQQIPDQLWQRDELPAQLLDQLTEEEKSAGNSPQRLHRLRQWQQETAIAFAQRAELEETFATQLESRAGDLIRQTATLRQEVDANHQELNEAHRQHQNLQLTLQARQAELSQLNHEYQQIQSQLDQRVIELAAVQQKSLVLTTEISQLRAQKTALELRLQAALDENNRLSERVQNLESAMQASLQHTAEQEQALIRWQELAERNEVQAKSLQQELETAHVLEQKNNILTAQLREERTDLRRQLTTLLSDRDQLAQNLHAQQSRLAIFEDLQNRYHQTQAEVTQLTQERDTFQQQLLLHEEIYQTLLQVQEQLKETEQQLYRLQTTQQQTELVLAERSQQLIQLQEQYQQLQESYQEAELLLAKQATEIATATQLVPAQNEELVDWLTLQQEWQTERAQWQNRLEFTQTEAAHWMKLAEQLSQKAAENAQFNEQEAALAELTHQLQKAERLADEYGDQLRWHKISLQTNREELVEAEELIGQYETAIAGINALMNEKDQLLAKWKTNVNQLTELLYLAEQRIKKTEAALTQYQEATRLETERLKEQLRHAQARRDSDKAELESYYASSAQQGEQLARLQSTLVEREMGLQKLQTETEKQKQTFFQIHEQATARIHLLEQEVAQTQRKLKDLTNYLERRNRTSKGEQ